MMNSTQEKTQPLVDVLRQRGGLTDLKVQEAFANVPRHLFLPEAPLETVYSDTSVPVCMGPGGDIVCSATMPSMIAFMLDQLDIRAGYNVLEIGTGTGYVAALLRSMVHDSGKVTTLEIDPLIAQMAQDNLLRAAVTGVNVVNVDGASGYAPRAAYDRIVATTGIWDVPAPWIRQLKPNGRMVVPVWLDGLQVTTALMVQPDGSLYGETVMPSAFVYIRGEAAGPNVRKRIGSTALNLLADEVDKFDTVSLHLLLSEDHEPLLLSSALDSEEYWYGFLPFAMLTEREDEIFALYDVPNFQKAYGLEGEGFALIGAASACFIPYCGAGHAHSYGGVEAWLGFESHLKAWEAAGTPRIDRLRLRFVPRANGKPEVAHRFGKVYTRRDHYLYVWLEDEPTD